MRIGIEAQRLLRPHKHGMDIVALELIRALQQLDQENDYFIFVRPDEDEACLTLTGNFTLVKVPGMNYVHWEQIALPRAIRAYKLDVLHCTANTAPLWIDVPLMLTLHDVLFLRQAFKVNTATAYQRLGNRYRALLVRQLVKNCRDILTISKYAAYQIKSELRIPRARIEVLYNGLSSRFDSPVTTTLMDSVRERYQLPNRYFFFLGSADPRKNIKNVLQAFVRYAQIDTEVRLVVSGKFPPFLKKLLTPMEYAFVQQRCQFIGYIADEDLPALYSLAEIFLFPSISEGFGLPILEAMACGTPVITSTLTAMPEVAGGAALLVDPHQPDAIARAIQQIGSKPLLRQLLIDRGKEQVTNFSWLRTARQLQAIYKTYAPNDELNVTPAYSLV
jgi:glycosyltransferase involved in cell wall biosynthesis